MPGQRTTNASLRGDLDDPQDGWIDEDEEIDPPLIELSDQSAWEETS